MNKKIIFIGLILGIVLVSGCIKKELAPEPEGPEIAVGPRITLEATVISPILSSEEDCERLGYSKDDCPSYIYPRDKGVIRIDKIVSCEEGTPPSDGREIAIVSVCDKLSLGEMIEVDFYYSSRPAKIVTIPPTEVITGPPETPVSKPHYPVTKENGYFVFKEESTLVEEQIVTILPGLEVGSKFHYSGGLVSVGKYEVIS